MERALAFVHHRSIVLLLCGGVKSGVAERRREVDDCAAGKGEHGRYVRLFVMGWSNEPLVLVWAYYYSVINTS
jgi:hypothetical protein